MILINTVTELSCAIILQLTHLGEKVSFILSFIFLVPHCLKEFTFADKILVGTDYPFVSEGGIGQILTSLEQFPGFSSKELELIKYKNMETLFPRFK